MSRVAACTIVARNYLALARALGTSLAGHHPGIDFHVLVIDADPAEGDLGRPRARRWAPEAIMPAATFAGMRARYDVTELSTAVKPAFMRALLADGYDRAIYFDPDILVTASLDPLLAELDAAAIVLVPHILAPIPEDGLQPDEPALLRAGAYNLGFLAVADRPATHAFLAWWQDRLEDLCLIAVDQGLFVDQKWVDLVPGMFDGVRILRDPGYDVAYWNLHERPLAEADGTYTAGGAPLRFFHFSGHNPDHPAQLSKHQTRHVVVAGSPLARLLATYAEALAAHDHAATRKLPYGHGTFSDGTPFDHVCRGLLRDDPKLAATFPDPFDAAAAPSYLAWLNQPARGKAGSTRYMAALHARRGDLRAAFPDPFGRDREAFHRWFATRAGSEGVPAAFVPAAEVAAGAPAPAPTRPGVNVAGYLTAELGIGQAARGYVRGLEAAGLAVALTNFTQTLNRLDDATLGGFVDASPYPVNMLCINADQVPAFLRHMGPGFAAGKANVGLWAWELPTFPQAWEDRFRVFDEIWVGSGFMAAAIAPAAPVPVITIPYVVDPAPAPPPDRARFGLPGGDFLFLFAFDYQSIFARKNPLGLVEAFRRAFRPDEPVRLVLKSINGEHHPAERAALRAATEGLRVTFLGDYLSRAEKDQLTATCDAYVSLHRAEGFGLGMAEAMALGKPVIATAWSGNLEFMTVANSWLVGYDLVELDRDHGPYRRGERWAEPDLDHAAALMREVVADPAATRARAERGRRDVRERHSPAAIGKLMAARLERLAGGPRPDRDPHAFDLPAGAGMAKPTVRQGLGFVRQALRTRPELILRPEWASSSEHGRKGVWAKKVVQLVARAWFGARRARGPGA